METTVNEELLSKIADSKHLSSLPEVAMRLIEIAQQADPDTQETCQIIRSDPAISGKILKTVNSALFAFRPRVETIDQAVPKLGTSLIRTLILSFHLSTHQIEDKDLKPLFQKLWRSCLTQAVFAELLAEKVGADPSSCFMGAMLQDIGILAMVSELPTEYIDNVLGRSEFPNVVAAEQSHFGFSHVDVSFKILEKWNLRSTYGDAIRHHHDKMSKVIPGKNYTLRSILQAANMGAELIQSDRNSGLFLDSLLNEWLGFLGTHFSLNFEQAEQLISEVNDRIHEYSVVFNFDIGENLRAEQVISDAKELLHEIAINNQLNLLAKTSDRPSVKPEKNELYRDFLTNLFNRRFINEHLGGVIENWISRNKPVATMFLDVDKFKSINDRYGHQVGDDAIRHIAQWLCVVTRASDYVIRLGGDEFLIVMQIKENDFEAISDRIVREIPQMPLADGKSVVLSLSVGCIFYQPGRNDVIDVNRLIDQADRLMYRVKKKGGASVSIHKLVGQKQLVF